MPLFTVSKNTLQPVAQSKFQSEKVLQQLVEASLDAVFKCRLVATEFPTGGPLSTDAAIDVLIWLSSPQPIVANRNAPMASEEIRIC